jgi:hypothetical protein
MELAVRRGWELAQPVDLAVARAGNGFRNRVFGNPALKAAVEAALDAVRATTEAAVELVQLVLLWVLWATAQLMVATRDALRELREAQFFRHIEMPLWTDFVALIPFLVVGDVLHSSIGMIAGVSPRLILTLVGFWFFYARQLITLVDGDHGARDRIKMIYFSQITFLITFLSHFI